MNVYVVGKAKRVSNEKLIVATKWLGNKLVGPKLAPNLGIEIKLTPNLRNKKKAYGLCCPAYPESKHREFDIELDSNLSQRSILEALCHEMVHVKQYARGELQEKFVQSLVKTYWMGSEIDHDNLDYWDRPWEIEAHGRERGLFLYLTEHFDDIGI